jgi:formate dehydrogenase maturation protein FdhE
LNTRPYQIIEETVAAYKDKLEKKRLRKSKTWLVYLRALLKKVFHRKTAMERYQEEIEFQKERRASRNPRDWL